MNGFIVDPYEAAKAEADRRAMRFVLAVMKKLGVTQVDIEDVRLHSDDVLIVDRHETFLRIKGKFQLDKANASASADSVQTQRDRLLDALKLLDKRLRECSSDPISAAEAYDSFYQQEVADAIAEVEAAHG